MNRPNIILSALLLLAASAPAQTRKLDTTSMVVLGEGLAAGLHDFTLSSQFQQKSFPAQIAKQLKTSLVQPLIQAPGIGNAPGWPEQPSIVTRTLQTTLRTSPPSLFVQNLSVPGLKLADAVSRRPLSPLIHRNDSLQTTLNLILGFPALVLEVDGKTMPLWSQLEYAQKLQPTFAIVELGFVEALEAAFQQDTRQLPDVATFRTNYTRVVSSLRSQSAEVVVMTIPDPLDTAYFIPVPAAAKQLNAQLFFLLGLYEFQPEDLLTVHGLNDISFQFFDRRIVPVKSAAVVKPSAASSIRAAVKTLNSEITSIAQSTGAVVFDLAAYLAQVRTSGVTVGGRSLAAGYLEGFYSMNAVYPGQTGHALIANEVLALLNKTYGTSFSAVDTSAVLAGDQTAKHSRLQGGSQVTLDDFRDALGETEALQVEKRIAAARDAYERQTPIRNRRQR